MALTAHTGRDLTWSAADEDVGQLLDAAPRLGGTDVRRLTSAIARRATVHLRSMAPVPGHPRELDFEITLKTPQGDQRWTYGGRARLPWDMDRRRLFPAVATLDQFRWLWNFYWEHDEIVAATHVGTVALMWDSASWSQWHVDIAPSPLSPGYVAEFGLVLDGLAPDSDIDIFERLHVPPNLRATGPVLLGNPILQEPRTSWHSSWPPGVGAERPSRERPLVFLPATVKTFRLDAQALYVKHQFPAAAGHTPTAALGTASGPSTTSRRSGPTFPRLTWTQSCTRRCFAPKRACKFSESSCRAVDQQRRV